MTDDLKDEINEIHIRIVKLEAHATHHVSKVDGIEARFLRLEEKVESSTKEILKGLAETGKQVANLRGWVVGLGVGGGIIFAAVQAAGALGVLG